MAEKAKKKETKLPPALKLRDPLEGLPYGVNALIRNEGSTIESVSMSEIDAGDDFWRLRPVNHVDLLGESIKMVGQRSPAVLRFREDRGRWQIISGFRRFEALKKLGRRDIIARIFDNFSDDDALRTAVMDNFFSGDVSGSHLDSLMDRLHQAGLLTAAATDFLDWAREKVVRVASTTAELRTERPVQPADETDAALPEMIDRTFGHLSDAGQGLEQIFLNWSDVSAADRRLLAAECKYIHDLYPFLTR